MNILITGIDSRFDFDGHWGSVSEKIVIHGNGHVSDEKGRSLGKDCRAYAVSDEQAETVKRGNNGMPDGFNKR